MSIYRDTNTSVVLEHPFPGPLSAAVYREGVTAPILTSTGLTPDGTGRYTLPLSYHETQFDGKLTINWSGKESDQSDFLRTTSVDVVTPLVATSELRTIFTDTNWTDPELVELENTVRTFIESYTRQSFGYQIGTLTVIGTGEKKISLPKRLLSLNTVVGGPAGYFAVSNDGWSLLWDNANYLSIKEVPPEEFIDSTTVVSGVIYVPDSYWTKFRRGAQYDITGEWGYYNVPDDVRAAAKLMASDYASGDALYRDRYLDQMKSGDWLLAFNKGAFRGTGNVRADHLLEPYRREGMIII